MRPWKTETCLALSITYVRWLCFDLSGFVSVSAVLDNNLAKWQGVTEGAFGILTTIGLSKQDLYKEAGLR